MNANQEPKYKIVGDQIVNRASGEAIPEDEPLMIFRARDVHAAGMIREYAGKVRDAEHRSVVLERAADFEQFAADHSDRMKEPDTVRADLEG
ncbi:MAG: hypothetical protein AAGA96_09720 [Verrucomicrobiota bacterium]